MSFTFAIMVQPTLMNAAYAQSSHQPQVKHPYTFENVYRFIAGAFLCFSDAVFPP
jgi:hypothetical protein